MPLNVTTKTKNGKHVVPEFCSKYRDYGDETLHHCAFSELLYLICTALDEAAVSDDTCIILGTTRDRTSYSCTVKYRGSTSSVYGATANDLLVAVVDLVT